MKRSKTFGMKKGSKTLLNKLGMKVGIEGSEGFQRIASKVNFRSQPKPDR